MTELKYIPILMPFSSDEYYSANLADRIELLKQWAAQIARHTTDFSWDDLRQRFEKNRSEALSCEHEVQTLQTVLKYEAALDAAAKDFLTLRASMEDLCKEMEQVREENQTFVMGPGVKRD